MPRRTTSLISLCVTVAAAAVALASCGTSQSSGPGQGSSAPSQAGSSQTGPSKTAAPSASASSGTPVSCAGGWQTGPTAVTRQVTVPPVPVATAIRTGSHSDCRFDRLTIDVSGVMPGYLASFVAQVIQDASGKIIAMPGSTHLVIKLKPAQGHTASGSITLPQQVRTLSYPMLRSYAVNGDFEGVLSIALGLHGGTKYRVGELPGRIYIDVAW